VAKQRLGRQSHVTAEKTEQGVTSSGVSTLGMRFFCAGRFRPLSQGRSTPSTFRYRNKMALSAWLWVDGETCRSFVMILIKD
jgi:hypothetical protein